MNIAIVAAAGEGSRFGNPGGKQYVDLLGKPLLAYAVEAFQQAKNVDGIVIVTVPERIKFCQKEVVDKFGFSKVIDIVAGGIYRQDSVFSGFKSLSQETDKVIIHDGARPLIKAESIDEVTDACTWETAAIAAVPVSDTIKLSDIDNLVINTIERERLWSAQTPQVFSYQALLKAFNNIHVKKLIATDDAFMLEDIGFPVKIVMGDYNNIKVTTGIDLKVAEALLKERKRA